MMNLEAVRKLYDVLATEGIVENPAKAFIEPYQDAYRTNRYNWASKKIAFLVILLMQELNYPEQILSNSYSEADEIVAKKEGIEEKTTKKLELLLEIAKHLL